MKAFRLILAAMLALLGSSATTLRAQEIPEGIYAIGSEVTTLETGKWYYLYNHGTQKYIQENVSAALKQVGAPEGVVVSENPGYLFTLEDAGNGNYYIRTGRGNYVKGPSGSARGTGLPVTESWAMAIVGIEGADGHFLLQGTSSSNSNYVMTAPSTGADIKGNTTAASKTKDGIGDWGFVEVKTTAVEDLKGEALYNYQISHLSLFRLRSKRTSTAYLTTTTAGSATGAKKASTGFSQVWIAEKSGTGYTIRSAETGEFLQANFAAPGSAATTMYIQYSPNNNATQAFVNVSSAADFSGQTCLNLGTNGTTLYKWSYAGDAGCDWAIELVDDVTEDQIRDHLNEGTNYVGELTDGAYYRLVCPIYSRIATEANGLVKSIAQDDTNYAQYWKLTKSGTGYTFQNVLTEKYIQRQTTTSAIYQTGTTATVLYPTRVADKWTYKWVITNTSGGTSGMHTAEGQGYNVVLWATSAGASAWAFQPVELSEEEIAAARQSYKAYEELVQNKAVYQQHLSQLFADWACTTLRAQFRTMTDEELAANEDFAALTDDLKALVLKVKNDTWQQYTNASTGYTAGYEKFFRVADYQVYSHYQKMANASNFTMSNSFGKLSGPTGIVANPDDIIYVFVDEAPSADCTLQIEAVSTSGVPGNNQTGVVTNLEQGLNILHYDQQQMLYVFYQLEDPKKMLADYPDIKVHIEGGTLNGYWDATRGMTNDDWALLQQDLLQASPVLNLKTKHLVFAMDAALVKKCEPKEMEGLMRVWDMIPENEERYMGVEDFEGRYRNIWNVFSINYQYMFASTYGTYYNESTLPTIMNYYNMTHQAGNLWGPSHEMGHNHQSSINVIGTTESSNNMFSNINIFEQGIAASRRQGPAKNFEQLAAETPWLKRDIWLTTSMFYQLYLYFHVQHHDDNFLPNLFRLMRKNPINKWSGPGSPTSYGKDDYLHLAKMICDAAQADLSEFFEAYGMFYPVSMVEVGDYSNYTVTTTQKDVNEAKAYMQKYEKKLGNIMFIDDRVKKSASNPDNIFLGVPSSDLRVAISDEDINQFHTSWSGHFELFTDEAEDVTNDWYKLSANGKTITFQGSDYAGHKFYDAAGNLIWATVVKSVVLPQKVLNVGMENITVKTAMYNMKDAVCLGYDPVGVSDLRSDAEGADGQVIYDLAGRRVNQAGKPGIYIVNGKKAFVK